MREEAKVIVFCCNWSVYPGLQLSTSSPTTEVDLAEPIVTMCSGRVSAELILEAFSQGAWGVMVAGCPPEECEHNGNYKAKRRILLLQNLLKQLGIECRRVRFESFATGESLKLGQTIRGFVDEMRELGPIE